MVLLLRVNVLEHGVKLTRAHRKRAIPALPEKAAIASIKFFDPLRGYLGSVEKLRAEVDERRRRAMFIDSPHKMA